MKGKWTKYEDRSWYHDRFARMPDDEMVRRIWAVMEANDDEKAKQRELEEMGRSNAPNRPPYNKEG